MSLWLARDESVRIIYFGVVSLVRQIRVELIHSQFRARTFVVGELGLRTEHGMPFDCWCCYFYVVEFVQSSEGSCVLFLDLYYRQAWVRQDL